MFIKAVKFLKFWTMKAAFKYGFDAIPSSKMFRKIFNPSDL